MAVISLVSKYGVIKAFLSYISRYWSFLWYLVKYPFRRGYIWEYTDVSKYKHGYYEITYDNGSALCIFTKYDKIYYAPSGAKVIKK